MSHQMGDLLAIRLRQQLRKSRNVIRVQITLVGELLAATSREDDRRQSPEAPHTSNEK
jgi:hypothetical protein